MRKDVRIGRFTREERNERCRIIKYKWKGVETTSRHQLLHDAMWIIHHEYWGKKGKRWTFG
jgi:hypothetical protein